MFCFGLKEEEETKKEKYSNNKEEGLLSQGAQDLLALNVLC